MFSVVASASEESSPSSFASREPSAGTRMSDPSASEVPVTDGAGVPVTPSVGSSVFSSYSPEGVPVISVAVSSAELSAFSEKLLTITLIYPVTVPVAASHPDTLLKSTPCAGVRTTAQDCTLLSGT